MDRSFSVLIDEDKVVEIMNTFSHQALAEIISFSFTRNNIEELSKEYKSRKQTKEYIKTNKQILEETFTDRELRLLINVLDYVNAYSQAGLPGHNLMVIIGKLLEVIDISENNIRDAITENEIPF